MKEVTGKLRLKRSFLVGGLIQPQRTEDGEFWREMVRSVLSTLSLRCEGGIQGTRPSGGMGVELSGELGCRGGASTGVNAAMI